MASGDDRPELEGQVDPVRASPTRSFRLEYVEGAVKLLGVFAVASYAIGLLVVNVYLLKLGSSDFSLLRPRFVMTGLFQARQLAAEAQRDLTAGRILSTAGTMGRAHC